MKILIVSDIPPCREYTAGLVEETFCNYLIKNNIRFSLLIVQSEVICANIPEYIKNYADSISFLSKRSEQCAGLTASKKFLKLLSNEIYACHSLSKKAKEKYQNETFDLLWGIVQGQTMVSLVLALAKLLKIKYNVQVWDPPEWWLKEHNFSDFFYRRVLSKFKKLLSHSNYCLTASPAMSMEYYRKFGCHTTELMPSLPEISNLKIGTTLHDSGRPYKIIFSGQKYAKKELFCFLKALDSLGWQYNGRKIQFDIYSNYLDHIIFSEFPLVRQYKWIDQSKLHEKIAGSDLAYCPYPFSEDMRLVSRLSFPGKLVSYLHCLVPIFFHGPAGSSITSFAQTNRFKFICESLDQERITEILLKALSLSENEKKEQIEHSYKVFNTLLSSEVMFRNISKAIGK